MFVVLRLLLLFLDYYYFRHSPNIAPVCDAGPSFGVAGGNWRFILNGSGSYDPDKGPSKLQYKWDFIMGPFDRDIVESVDDNIYFSPYLVVSSRNLLNGLYVFRLVLDDGLDTSYCDVHVLVYKELKDEEGGEGECRLIDPPEEIVKEVETIKTHYNFVSNMIEIMDMFICLYVLLTMLEHE